MLVLLCAAKGVEENAITLSAEPAENFKRLLSSSPCAASCAKFKLRRSWGGTETCPSSTRGGDHQRVLLSSGRVYRPAIPSIARKYPLAWLNFLLIVMENILAALLKTFRVSCLLANVSMQTNTALNMVRSSPHVSPWTTRCRGLVSRSLRVPVGHALYYVTQNPRNDDSVGR